jgi:hypothetical protein
MVFSGDGHRGVTRKWQASRFWPLNPVERMIPSPRSDAGLAILISVAVVLYTTPQLLVALLAGRLSSKYRIIIERR